MIVGAFFRSGAEAVKAGNEARSSPKQSRWRLRPENRNTRKTKCTQRRKTSQSCNNNVCRLQ